MFMCFAAVYMNHHYILDLIWGSAYTVLVYLVMKRRYEALNTKYR